MGINLAKCSGADLFTQVALEKKSVDQVGFDFVFTEKCNACNNFRLQIDFKRNGVFVVFGFVYLGGFQYFVLVNKVSTVTPASPRLFIPSTASP